MSHHALRGGKRNIPHRDHWDGGEVNCARSRDAGNEHPDCTETLADVKGAAFTKPADNPPGQASGNCRSADAHEGERNSDHRLRPLVAIDRVKRPDYEHFMRDVGEKLQRGQLPQFWMRPE